MSTALSFKYISGGSETTVNFTDEEVEQVIIATQQGSILTYLQNGNPILYYTNNGWREITIHLRPEHPTVSEYVNTLRQVTSIMAMLVYYQNGTLAENIPVSIDPNAELYYMSGYKDADKTIQLILHEAISGKAAVRKIGGK